MHRLILVLIFLVAALPSAAVRAQSGSDTTYVSQITGKTVDLGDSGSIAFAPELEEFYETSIHREEYLGFTTMWSTFQIGFIKGPITTADLRQSTTITMQQSYDSLEILVEDIGANNAWFMAEVTMDGVSVHVYYEHQTDAFGDVGFLFIQYSDEANMVNDFRHVQQNVTIGGSPLVESTNPARLTSALAGESEPATSDAGLLETMRPTSSDGDAALLSSLVGGSESSSSEPADIEVWKDKGIVSESEWVSPMYGTSVKWDPSVWEFPFEYPFAYRSSVNPPFESISLVTADAGVWVDVNIHNTGSYLTPKDYLDWWWTAEYAAEYTGGFTILDSKISDASVAVVAQVTDSTGQPMLMILTASFLPDGKVVQTQLYVFPDQVEPAYRHLQESILVNGSPLDLTWTLMEIENMITD